MASRARAGDRGCDRLGDRLVRHSAGCAAAARRRRVRGLDRLLVGGSSEGKVEYVRLDRGELGWGGGIDAFDRRTSWGMPLGAEDCARVAAELAAIDWAAVAARQESVTEDRAYVVIVTGRPDEHRVRVQADDAAIAGLRSSLMAIAARRLDGTLDELPKAGQRFDQTRD